MTRRAVVTGGCGFVGSAVVRRLLDDGFEVTVVDDLSAGEAGNLPQGSVRLVEADLADTRRVRRAIPRDAVLVHLAALPFVPDSWTRTALHHARNTALTDTVLELARMRRTARVVFAGTAEVYGATAAVPIAEDHPIAPMSPYARSKAEAEEVVARHRARGLPVVTLRLFNAYGPREGWPFLVPEVIRQCLKDERIDIGNLASRRDFTFVEDTAAAIVRAATAPVEAPAINVGTGVAWSVEEIVGAVRRLTGSPARVRIDARRRRPQDPPALVADNGLALRELGWRPTVDLEEGLRLTIEWYEQAGSEWSYERRWARELAARAV